MFVEVNKFLDIDYYDVGNIEQPDKLIKFVFSNKMNF